MADDKVQSIEFYDVRLRQKVSVPIADVKRTKYERTAKDGSTQVRYAVKAEVKNGDKVSRLTKFVSKEVWDSMDNEIV